MFEYGDIPKRDPHFKVCIEREFFERNQYEKYHSVQEGDVVVDIGASIGPFLYNIKDRKPNRVIAVEPFASYQGLLKTNSKPLNVEFEQSAIDYFGNSPIDLEWSSEHEKVGTITFGQLREKYKLDHIDYLKLDCEGGEYYIFTEQHIEFLKNNVKYIVGEFHLNTDKPELIEHFIEFYNLIEEHNFNFIIETIDGQPIEKDLDHITEHFQQVIIYMDNRDIKQKLLYIAPHLSTGGLPQYLTKKVELLKDEFDIHLVEWNNSTGGVLIVQREQLQNLIKPENFYTLGADKREIISIINKIRPDIIHMEEIPEFFMDFDLASEIYDVRRTYFIVETSHDSSFDVSTKRLFPDKFLFVSEYQKEMYKHLDIPSEIIYYPIEYKERPDRTEALEKLNLDPSEKHILHVGLFTRRKNQAEFFEYARSIPEMEFHCVGNQADNFKDYWEPLMKTKPDNVTWWGERKDVDSFYSAMDLFLFTSRGTDNDKETMPLVIREAISWDMEILIYDLDVYLSYFDQFLNVYYLELNDHIENISGIYHILGENTSREKIEIAPEEEAIIISTYPITKAIINTTKECILAAKKSGRKIILTSHIAIPEELSNIVDYCVVDNNNILTKHTYYSRFHKVEQDYRLSVNLQTEGNSVYHGPAVYSNYYNGCALATNLLFFKVYFLNYDYILKDPGFIDLVSQKLNSNDVYTVKFNSQEGGTVMTWFMGIDPGLFLSLPKIDNGGDYDELMSIWNSESNGLENIIYHWLNTTDGNGRTVYWEKDFNQEKLFDHKDYSQVEYYTVLQCNEPNYIVPYFNIANNVDSREIKFRIERNGEIEGGRSFRVTSKMDYLSYVKFTPGDVIIFRWQIYDLNNPFIELDRKEIRVDNKYMSTLHNNGECEFSSPMRPMDYTNRPKIKLLHLVTDPNKYPKEKRSIVNLMDFCRETGIKYEKRTNEIYDKLPPKENCARPEVVQTEPGHYKLSAGHYGCYLAHKNAILDEDNENYDYILIFEGDVVVDHDYKDLYEDLYRLSQMGRELFMDVIGFGNPWQDRNLNGPKIRDLYTDVTPFIPAQSYLINTGKELSRIQNKLKELPWDAIDLWMCNVANLRIGTAETIYTKHIPGYSLVEKTIKNGETDNPLIFLKE